MMNGDYNTTKYNLKIIAHYAVNCAECVYFEK